MDGKRILLGKGISIDKVRCTVKDLPIHEREITQNSLRFSVTKSVWSVWTHKKSLQESLKTCYSHC